jgi:hypothetical protein
MAESRALDNVAMGMLGRPHLLEGMLTMTLEYVAGWDLRQVGKKLMIESEMDLLPAWPGSARNGSRSAWVVPVAASRRSRARARWTSSRRPPVLSPS